MRENLLFTTRNWFYRIMFLFVLVCTSAMSQAAAPTDLGELELDKEYTLEANFQKVYATFTVPKDGVLTCQGGAANDFTVYEDEDHTKRIDGEWDFATQSRTIKVTANQKLYFFNNFCMNGGTFKLTMPGEEGIIVEMKEVSPESGSIAPTAAGGMVNVFFNVPVVATSAVELYVGDTSIGTVSPRIGGTVLSVEIAQYLLKAYDTNKVKEGDILTLKIHVAAKNDTNVKKDFEVTYNCPAAIVHLKNPLHIPAAFLSYWTTGDMDGILKLEFTGNLASTSGEAILGYGDLESETSDYYTETIPFAVDGNILSVDFTGKLRTPDTMVSSGTNYGIMSLQIKNVKDADGNFVYSEGQGTIGSYSYNFEYKLLSFDIDKYFIPEEGASLVGEKEVEIWIRGEENLIYNGVKFTYVEGGITKEVVVTDVNRDATVPGEVTLIVAIPEEVVGKTNIEVSLNELQSKDGLNHQISARYDSFVVTVETPEEDTMEVLTAGTIFNVSVNNEAVGYMEYEIHDLNPTDPDQAIIKSYSWLTKQEDGTWKATVYGNYKFIKGHDYAVIFTAYASEDDRRNGIAPIGTDRYIIHGASVPYMNSDLVLETITPNEEAGFASEEDNVITVKFSGPVMLTAETTFINEGSGMTVPFTAIEAVDAIEEGYANTWKLTVPESYFAGKSSVAVSFVAEDMNGRRLNGNEDRTGETAYFYYDIPCTFAIPDFTVIPVDNEELKSLSEITVGYEAGINISWDGSKVQVFNRSRELVATVIEETQIIPEEEKDNWDYQPKEMVLTLDNTIDQNGAYYILFPAGHFILGSQYGSSASKQTIINFIIDNPVEQPETAIAITDRGNGQLVLEFAEGAEPATNWECSEKILVKNAGGDVVLELTNESIGFDWDLPLNFLLLNGVNITEPGEYTIEFPAGIFFTDAMGTVPSTAVTVKYVVEGEEPELASGTYYLKNVESGKFLSSGNDWGTKATLGNGYDLIVTKLENGKYTIDTKIYNGAKHYLGSDAFMDGALAELTVTNVGNGVYTISADGTKLLAGNADNTVVDYLEIGADNAYAQWQFLTREELFANASAENPVNVTALIQGHSFAYGDNDRNAVWQEAPAIGGWNGNKAGRDNCAERYETQYADEGYNVGQTLTDMPAGVYQLTVQGFYRNGNNATASAAHNAGTESLDAYLYANDEVVALPSVYSEAKEASEGGWTTTTEAGFVPNTMVNAVDCFRAGAYKSEPLTVIVGEDGVLTLGIKKEGKVAADWTIFDNFELTYLGAVPEEEFAVTVLSPAEDTLEKLERGAIISITTNKAEAGYIVYEIHDLNPVDPTEAIIKSSSWMNKQEDGSFQAQIYGAGHKLLEGHDYAIIFTAYTSEEDKNYGAAPIGTDQHIIHGASVAYVNSDLVLETITPNAETGFTSEEDNVITVKFSGLVKLESSTTNINLGMGVSEEFESIEAVEPTEEGFAEVWKLTVPKSMFASSGTVDFAIVATDTEGRRLNGNDGRIGETAYFYYSIPCTFALPDFTVIPVDNEELKSLSEITVRYDGGINVSWDGSKIQVFSKSRELVATVIEETQIIPEEEKDNWDYQPEEMVLTLDNTIDKDGAYYILFPAGHFILGSQFESSASKQTIINFTIDNPVEQPETTIAVTDRGNGQLVLEFAEGAEPATNWECSENILVKNAGGDVVLELTNESIGFDWDLPLNFLLLNGVNITEPGEYTIEFPAGFFFTDAMGTVPSTAVTVKYVVEGEECVAIDGVNADGTGINADNFAVYTLTGVLVKAEANKADLKNLPAGIYIVNGKKYLVK